VFRQVSAYVHGLVIRDIGYEFCCSHPLHEFFHKMSHSDEDIMPVPEPISDASSKTSGESVEPKPDESETTGEKFPVMQTGVTSALQSFLEEHKEQSKVVQAVKNELTRLDKTPDEYFESRKKFLFHAYTQTLKDCPHTSEFDVKVTWNVLLVNNVA